MNYRHIKKWLLLAAIILSGFASHFSDAINAYYLQIVIFIGINIILAVGLNLINGFTGQFSLGHAGFMAIGAYTSACVTTWASTNGGSIAQGNDPAMFAIALIIGGILAAIAGLGVGIPSLRLRGDYLAIVTL